MLGRWLILKVIYRTPPGEDVPAEWGTFVRLQVYERVKVTSHLRGCPSRKKSYARQFQQNPNKLYISKKLNERTVLKGLLIKTLQRDVWLYHLIYYAPCKKGSKIPFVAIYS